MVYRWLFGALCAVAVHAHGARFEIKDAGFRNLLYVISDALLEKMIGQSNAVEGWIELNPQKIRDGVQGRFVADLRALETGSMARNDLVLETILLAPEHPILTYEFTKIGKPTAGTLGHEVPVVIRVEGQLTLRGVSRPVPIFLRLYYLTESEVTRARLPGNLIKISTSFDVNLAEFGMSIPQALSGRVAQTLQLSLDAIGTDMSAASVVVPAPDGPKPKQAPSSGRVATPREPAALSNER